MPIKINGSTSGSTTITAPATGSDETIELSTALAAKLASADYKPGLVLVAAQSFSAVSSVSVNNCFSATYENYRIMLSITSQTSANDINVRMRASGVDTSSATYNSAYSRGGRTTLADGGSTSGGTFWIPVSGTNAYLSHIAFDILRANVSGQAGFLSHSFSYDGGYLISFRGGVCTQATSHDGISFISTAGTITGTVRVYGYRNSL